ncbi:hypothetical protein FDC49_18055 [Clostridium sporogenes]|uniref:hypothetical protein n=1 Tax=Clostridium sporogenes TaxID=1509 RepID=UPI0013D43C8D|nr:hypothetical protein [Clostridium sporogenes]NFH34359.1 hypothetical protein [Clostridium sporogenes]NFL21609.1 hypothetical protein [Clostridium sporogenes]NFN73463.1 hypothetical protein [Clostridium sporogenes]NFV23080.1 hypothetical protein [Clostridium sporogenes]
MCKYKKNFFSYISKIILFMVPAILGFITMFNTMTNLRTAKMNNIKYVYIKDEKLFTKEHIENLNNQFQMYIDNINNQINIGLSILGIAISVWVSLNIYNIIEKNDLKYIKEGYEEVDLKLKELSKEYEKKIKFMDKKFKYEIQILNIERNLLPEMQYSDEALWNAFALFDEIIYGKYDDYLGTLNIEELSLEEIKILELQKEIINKSIEVIKNNNTTKSYEFESLIIYGEQYFKNYIYRLHRLTNDGILEKSIKTRRSIESEYQCKKQELDELIESFFGALNNVYPGEIEKIEEKKEYIKLIYKDKLLNKKLY